jgi:hypothetical protein
MITFNQFQSRPELLLGNFTLREVLRLKGTLPETAQEWLVGEYDRQRQVEALARELLEFLPWHVELLNSREQEIVHRLQKLMA